MSDPVKSVEIEDVLSSIRRLLADGDPHGTSAKSGPRPVDPALQASVPPTRGRAERRADAPLVLTPALRVAGRPEPQGVTAPTPFPAGPGRTLATEPDALDDDFQAPSLPTARKPQDSALRSRLEATIAELEAAITHQVDEWEPDGSEPAPVMDWAQARAEDAPFLSRRHANSQPQVPTDQRPAEVAPVPEAGFHDGLSDETAFDTTPASDQATASVARPFEPSPEVTALVEEGAEAFEPQPVVGAPIAETAANADVEPIAQTSVETPQIDEAMLRELIVEVLRDELRGPLGDRITSNLRKLVRREIFRALASGEVD
ncbi:hypothetical protein [uncultured Limimaricola sp.]|uniref:hypothetical protein n=1 Tax=uncultured Limimaricola sp. TaxID=2211667 RepID=UPI0030F50EE2